MKKTILSILVALVLLAGLPITASAHPVPEEGRTGSITVSMRYGGKPLSGGQLTIYQVGQIAISDGNYSFVPTEAFAEWDGEFGSLENPDTLAKSLAEFASDRSLIGTKETVGKNGKAVFDGPNHMGLQQGLYLVTQTVPAKGYSAIAPFLVSIPYLDEDTYIYNVSAKAKTEPEKTEEPTRPTESVPSGGKLPQTGQLWWPVPVLICAGLICIVVGLIRRRESENET